MLINDVVFHNLISNVKKCPGKEHPDFQLKKTGAHKIKIYDAISQENNINLS